MGSGGAAVQCCAGRPTDRRDGPQVDKLGGSSLAAAAI